MSGRNLTELVALLSVVVLAGCSGVLSGGDAGAATSTPGQDTPETPTQEATPTPTVTPTPTPRSTLTPTPGYLNYDSYASQMGALYDDYPPRDFLYDSSGSADDRLVSVTVTKPEDWTVQDAEMEAARDLALTAFLSTRPTVEAAKGNDDFLRPDTYRVRVVDQKGQLLSETSFDGDTAAAYADSDVTMDEFAARIAQRRTVHNESVTISKRDPELALRAAEYRPLQYRHLQRIANGSINDTPAPEINRAVMLPEEETIYYENVPVKEELILPQEGMVTRTYLEAIKDIFEASRVNRYPDRMVLFSDVSYSREGSLFTTAKTQWAFDYFAITNWTLPQNIDGMSAAALDAYYNKIERNKEEIEDDDNYDYVAEVRSQEGNDLNATVHDAYVLVEEDDD